MEKRGYIPYRPKYRYTLKKGIKNEISLTNT